MLPWFLFAGGTSVHTIEGSFDRTNPDADFVITPTTAVEFPVYAPCIRWKTVQTVSDAIKSKIILRGRF